MAARLAIAAVIVAFVLLVAWWSARRRPAPPTRDAYPVPRQLDRNDFPRPDAALLVALFSSAACDSCRGLPAKLAPLESVAVATVDVSAEAYGELHRRYAVAAIPTTVVADAQGVVRKAFIGSVTATDLWAAVCELRAPGSTPEPSLGDDLS